ncbi:MAG: threonine/serine dehydratase [Pseudomonadota bacterium]
MTTATDLPSLKPPTFTEIEEAAEAIRTVAVRTPLLENAEINERLGGRLFIKAENLQRTGAFKLRGAYNRIRQLTDDERHRGVIAYSSGNHAQAVATAATIFETSAVIVMPADAPETKIIRTRQLGAEVITYDRNHETREAVAERIQAARNMVLVPPGEDGRVLAGGATVSREIFEDSKAMGVSLDTILTPCGGGGLTSTTALNASQLSPGTQVFGVEPELFDDTKRSLAAGHPVPNPKGRKTICDSIMTDKPGPLTFSINQTHLNGVLTVTDDEVRMAMKVGFDAFKMVIEPGAAVGLAAVLAGKVKTKANAIAVVATGGNVDAAFFCECYRLAHEWKT